MASSSIKLVPGETKRNQTEAALLMYIPKRAEHYLINSRLSDQSILPRVDST